MKVIDWADNASIELLNKADDRAPRSCTVVNVGYRHPYYDTFDNWIEIPAEYLYSYPDETNELVEMLADDGSNFDEIFETLDGYQQIGVLRAADLICWVQTVGRLQDAEKHGDGWLVEIEQKLLDSGSRKFTEYGVGRQNHLIDKAQGTYIYYCDVYGDWDLKSH